MIPVVALSLGILIARVATVAAIPRAVGALRAFFCEPKTVERTSTAEKTPQSKTPPAIPATGTKEVVFTANSLNQRTSPGVNVYDAKGQTQDQNGRQFEWDDDGRLTAIIMDTHRSEFQYDGYGRRVRITEKENAVVQSDKLYFWVGGEIVCERDALQPGNPISKRFFGQGVIANGQKLYYTTDQLGSVRELVDATGEVRADYRYSVYGERTKIAGDLDSDWGWAGLWHHEPSGLDLATYRAYDPTMGRWLSRDPLGEGVDYNLYRYCGNDPVGCVDPAGLQPPAWAAGTIVRYTLAAASEIVETVGVVGEAASPYVGGLLDFLPAWAPGATAGTAATGLAGYYLINANGQAVPIKGVGPNGPIPFGGTSGGNPFWEKDPYSPEQVTIRLRRPEFRPNPKHNPRGAHPGASKEPCDSADVWNRATRTDWGIWWGQGKDGWYRFSDDNAGGVHFSGSLANNDPRVPNFLKKP